MDDDELVSHLGINLEASYNLLPRCMMVHEHSALEIFAPFGCLLMGMIQLESGSHLNICGSQMVLEPFHVVPRYY